VDRALPLLSPGQSLRFALLPQGLDPDDLVRREGAAAMTAIIGAAAPLSDMLWRTMAGGVDSSTPERRAGLEKALFDKLSAIRDDKVRTFYMRDFRERLYRAFRPARFSPGSARKARGRPLPFASTRRSN